MSHFCVLNNFENFDIFWLLFGVLPFLSSRNFFFLGGRFYYSKSKKFPQNPKKWAKNAQNAKKCEILEKSRKMRKKCAAHIPPCFMNKKYHQEPQCLEDQTIDNRLQFYSPFLTRTQGLNQGFKAQAQAAQEKSTITFTLTQGKKHSCVFNDCSPSPPSPMTTKERGPTRVPEKKERSSSKHAVRPPRSG